MSFFLKFTVSVVCQIQRCVQVHAHIFHQSVVSWYFYRQYSLFSIVNTGFKFLGVHMCMYPHHVLPLDEHSPISMAILPGTGTGTGYMYRYSMPPKLELRTPADIVSANVFLKYNCLANRQQRLSLCTQDFIHGNYLAYTMSAGKLFWTKILRVISPKNFQKKIMNFV